MMVTSAAISPATNEIDQLKSRLKTTWMAGDYDIFSRYLETDAVLFFRRIGVSPGTRMLDVGCGSGQLALIAARGGAQVTGCDIATNWIQRARERAKAEKLNAVFDEGDAESLPYADATFDVVASLLGAMFAPRPELVATELKRVCRVGGKIAMANWTPQGFVGQMFKTIAKYIAPSGMPSPVLWGDQAIVRDRFRDGVVDVKCKLRFYQFEYPFPPEMVVEFFGQNYGPMAKAFASLDETGRVNLKHELTTLWTSHNRAEGNRTLVDAEYLEVIAVRGVDSEPWTFVESEPQSWRAGLLADRLEEGAARLSEFAQQLTDEEWNTPVPEGGKPGRTVGTLLHHVASMYPIEVDVARAIANGNAVTHVTLDVVNEINANHALENANACRAETLSLLRSNSEAAAAAVREFTDEQLDRAAPFSLAFGAPVTAQFVLEDHAVRHSWHHLARIRKVVGSGTPDPNSTIR
jgi:ubiquinone/menaquinone biosynthesis C-methylase UbiE